MKIKKREGYRFIILEPAKTRIANNQCAGCGKSKSLWKRRTDWTCCSVECTEKYQKMWTVYGWVDLRMKVLKRDKFTCVKCRKKPKEKKLESILKKDGSYEYNEIQTNIPDGSELIGDHIKPIALGGGEWDMNNIQTLCIPCNKVKTKQDAKNIALRRKQIKHGRLFIK